MNRFLLILTHKIRKGKPAERRGRKATDLKPKGHDRRAAEPTVIDAFG